MRNKKWEVKTEKWEVNMRNEDREPRTENREPRTENWEMSVRTATLNRHTYTVSFVCTELKPFIAGAAVASRSVVAWLLTAVDTHGTFIKVWNGK